MDQKAHNRKGNHVGEFSLACSVDLDAIDVEPVIRQVPIKIFRAARRRKFDLIVTDPPYGFNTKEDPRKLAELYRVMIPRLLSALGRESHLVMAIPEWSHTGRQLPAFAYKEFITHQVLVVADSMRMDILRPLYASRWAGALFRAPFYWESREP